MKVNTLKQLMHLFLNCVFQKGHLTNIKNIKSSKKKLKQIKSIVDINYPNPKLNTWYQTIPPLKDEREEKLIHTPTKDLTITS